MNREIFVDGVLGAGFSGGALRVDFYSLSPGNAGEKTLQARLIMTPEGFAGCFKAMEGVMAKLAESGIVRLAAPVPENGEHRTARGQAAQETPRSAPDGQGGGDAAGPVADKGLSPNF